MNHFIEMLRERLKTVGKGTELYGRLYLPKELEGRKAAYITEEELNKLAKELTRYITIKSFSNIILNSKNGTKMFNIIKKTWNPITGCTHLCRYCWARKLALTKLKKSKKYKDGFVPKFHEDELRKKFNGGVVFVSDMGDMFCNGVPDEWIIKVIEHIKRFSNTYFLFLTKNPERYKDFIDIIPRNVILGATIETDRDDLYLEHHISNAPLPSLRYKAMKSIEWDMKFISIEPILDFSLNRFTQWIREINPFMIYVGYDNYNNKLPEPPLVKTEMLIEELSEFTIVIKKTIRKAWYEKGTITSYNKVQT